MRTGCSAASRDGGGSDAQPGAPAGRPREWQLIMTQRWLRVCRLPNLLSGEHRPSPGSAYHQARRDGWEEAENQAASVILFDHCRHKGTS